MVGNKARKEVFSKGVLAEVKVSMESKHRIYLAFVSASGFLEVEEHAARSMRTRREAWCCDYCHAKYPTRKKASNTITHDELDMNPTTGRAARGWLSA
jgi:hypothetical protein